jgi:hypothetical protein
MGLSPVIIGFAPYVFIISLTRAFDLISDSGFIFTHNPVFELPFIKGTAKPGAACVG